MRAKLSRVTDLCETMIELWAHMPEQYTFVRTHTHTLLPTESGLHTGTGNVFMDEAVIGRGVNWGSTQAGSSNSKEAGRHSDDRCHGPGSAGRANSCLWNKMGNRSGAA